MQYNSKQGTVLVEVFSSTEATYVGQTAPQSFAIWFT